VIDGDYDRKSTAGFVGAMEVASIQLFYQGVSIGRRPQGLHIIVFYAGGLA
jgi:hypothetical protein